MCGIAACVGRCAALKSLLLTLNQIERGKDGCGVAYLEGGHIKVFKAPLHPILFSDLYFSRLSLNSTIAISHNRLPSVGGKTYVNTHPFLSCDRSFAFAHNGHMFNHHRRPELMAGGHKIHGETDSEILMHVLEDRIREHGDIPAAIQDLIVHDLNGAIVMLTRSGELYFAKSGWVGLHYTQVGGEIYMASAASAIRRALGLLNIRRVEIREVKDGELVIVKDGEVEHLDSVKPKNRLMEDFMFDFMWSYKSTHQPSLYRWFFD